MGFPRGWVVPGSWLLRPYILSTCHASHLGSACWVCLCCCFDCVLPCISSRPCGRRPLRPCDPPPDFLPRSGQSPCDGVRFAFLVFPGPSTSLAKSVRFCLGLRFVSSGQLAVSMGFRCDSSALLSGMPGPSFLPVPSVVVVPGGRGVFQRCSGGCPSSWLRQRRGGFGCGSGPPSGECRP